MRDLVRKTGVVKDVQKKGTNVCNEADKGDYKEHDPD